MLRLRAFRASSEKIVHLELHPTHPWLVTADASDNVVVWNWEHRQVIYEVNAGGVDERRLVGAKLQKLAEGESELKTKITEAIRGGSVKQVKFYDEDVRFWQSWLNRAAAAEAPVAVNQQFPPIGGGLQAIRGRHFLAICCENKVIFLDMVTMRAKDVPKQVLENKSPLCMEFLSRMFAGDGPLVAFGGSDGVIRVISMISWQLVRKYIGGHKGAISCLLTFLASSGETLLVSGGSDGMMVLWSADNVQDARELAPKLSIKAHDGGVSAIALARVLGGAPQLITVGADKTLAVWDTVSFKELKRIKPVGRVACHSIASWCHPRVPNLDVLVCVKDSHIWAVQHSTYNPITRPLCDLSSQVPPGLLSPNKKLKCYCMAVHPLQPHLVATGTNFGVILSEFDARSVPAAVALSSLSGSKEHTAAFIAEREIRLLTFQLSAPLNPALGIVGQVSDTGRSRGEAAEAVQLLVKQTKRRVTTVPHDTYSCLSVSKSGKYVSVVWPDEPHYAVYRVSDWSVVDSGPAKHFAWDSCKERYALLEATVVPRLPPLMKGKRAKEVAVQAAAAAAAAANATAAATVQVRILLEDGSTNLLTRSIEGRSDPVIGLQGGALLGVAYKFPRRLSVSSAAAAASAAQGASISGIAPSFSGMEEASGGGRAAGEATANFQLYSWESFRSVSGLIPQPDWTAWDETVEYCALAYQHYIVIASLRPQYRYLGDVAIGQSTGGVWHRRQLFLATPTTIECVFVDAGVTSVDLERKRRKEELKAKDAQAKAVVEHGELALITVDTPHVDIRESEPLRPPMLQVVRLASFQHAPSVPPFMAMPKQPKSETEDAAAPSDLEERKPYTEVAVAGGGVSVALSRLPSEQKRPVGPLVVIGVRDGVLWLIDRYMTAHALGLSHPGIRCRCLAAYGDAVSAVKWATRLGREHHDDLAQFMLGMGYAVEALHLPGISKRLEFDLALKSNDLKRALQCLLTLSKSRGLSDDIDAASDIAGVLSLTSSQDKRIDATQGIISFSREFLELIDAADATGQTDIASQALRRLAAAALNGALQPHDVRGLALRLAAHGELTRLGVLVKTLINAGWGREAALASALLGDSALLEKSWQETGMYAEAALHAYAHGRGSLKTVLQLWNQNLQKELETVTAKAYASSLSQMETLTLAQKEPALQDFSHVSRKPLIEIVPPGNVPISQGLGNLMAGKSIKPSIQQSSLQSNMPLLLEGPSPVIATTTSTTATSSSVAAASSVASSLSSSIGFSVSANMPNSVAPNTTLALPGASLPITDINSASLFLETNAGSSEFPATTSSSQQDSTPILPVENSVPTAKSDGNVVVSSAPLLDMFFP